MIWRPFTSFLRNKAADAGDGGGSGGGNAGDAETGVVELSPKLSERLNPKQMEILRDRKAKKAEGGRRKAEGEEGAAARASEQQVVIKKDGTITGGVAVIPPEGGTTSHASAAAASAGAGAAASNDEGIVIDFAPAAAGSAGSEGAAAGAGEEPAEPDTTGLDDTRKKQLLDLHKDNAKIRKRAQDAEKERDELKTKHEEASKRLSERENSPPVASNNLFAGFKDPAQVNVWVNDAQERVNKLLDKSIADKKHKLPNGEEIDLAADEVASLLQAQEIMDHAAGWAEQRRTLGSSAEKAKPIVQAFEKVPEYAKHHAEIAKQNPHAHWPRLVATSAIGELVVSGKYRIVQNLSGKAAAASSAASTVSGAPSGSAGSNTANGSNASSKTAKAAPVEVANAVPSASRTDGKDGDTVDIPSELQKRARTGDQEALREIIRLKTRRGAQRQQAA